MSSSIKNIIYVTPGENNNRESELFSVAKTQINALIPYIEKENLNSFFRTMDHDALWCSLSYLFHSMKSRKELWWSNLRSELADNPILSLNRKSLIANIPHYMGPKTDQLIVWVTQDQLKDYLVKVGDGEIAAKISKKYSIYALMDSDAQKILWEVPYNQNKVAILQ